MYVQGAAGSMSDSLVQAVAGVDVLGLFHAQLLSPQVNAEVKDGSI